MNCLHWQSIVQSMPLNSIKPLSALKMLWFSTVCYSERETRLPSKLSMFVFGSRWLFRNKRRTQNPHQAAKVDVSELNQSSQVTLISFRCRGCHLFCYFHSSGSSTCLTKPLTESGSPIISSHNPPTSTFWAILGPKPAPSWNRTQVKNKNLANVRIWWGKPGQVSNEGRIRREGNIHEQRAKTQVSLDQFFQVAVLSLNLQRDTPNKWLRWRWLTWPRKAT